MMRRRSRTAAPLVIGGVAIEPGQRATVEIPVAQRYTHALVGLAAHVVRGTRDGPRLFVSGAIHGDEILGIEIVRRLLHMRSLTRLRGTLIAVPVVNVYGFLSHQRYLPDRRDLNRSFPGSLRGSLTARLAHLFMTEIVANATHGIDLHSGALHRANLPQIRACLDAPDTARLARAFGTPVIVNANLRDGSLRQAVLERQMPMLVYEAGEALRFDEFAIRVGVRGVVSVMRAIGMLPPSRRRRPGTKPFIARSTSWIRAPASGVLRAASRLGTRVKKGDLVGIVSSTLGESEVRVHADAAGVVIGCTNLPLVNEGDAILHVARFDRPASVVAQIDAFRADLDPLA